MLLNPIWCLPGEFCWVSRAVIFDEAWAVIGPLFLDGEVDGSDAGV